MTSASSGELLLAEELLLLALDDERGHDRIGGVDSGLAGALLLDLVAAGWLADVDGKLVPDNPAGAAPMGVLADALAVIRAERKARNAKHWVRALPRELRPIRARVASDLVERGILIDRGRKLLGLVPIERYPTADPAAERALRERLRAELTGAADFSARTTLLVPLLRPYRLVAKVVAKDERRAAARRAKQVVEDPGQVGAAVRSVLRDSAASSAGSGGF